MAKAGMTINDAAHEWVREMNAYPQEMIETLMQAKPDDWHEVTMPRVCDRVYVYNLPDGCEDYDPNGEIENIVGGVYLINLEDGNTIELGADDFEVERDSILPMWGWLWSFSDSADDYFMDELDGIKKMSECGFRIYEHDEWGYFFGIDGCGYSFYDEHWIPLYKKSGSATALTPRFGSKITKRFTGSISRMRFQTSRRTWGLNFRRQEDG